MEHPLFALKAGDFKPRIYKHNGVTLEISPNVKYGLATIHDKDIWIFCISHLMEAKKKGAPISRKVRFNAHDFLKSTNRNTGGNDYKAFARALERLTSTTIKTNIETNDKKVTNVFTLLGGGQVTETDRDKNKMVAVEVAIPDWLYEAIEGNEVLTISPDYFRLRKPIDRRIYELARKHVGHQKKWRVSVATLLKKSGSTTSLKAFKQAMKSLAASNELPDYRVRMKDDFLTFYNRKRKEAHLAEASDILVEAQIDLFADEKVPY